MKKSSSGNYTIYESTDPCGLHKYSETLAKELEKKDNEIEKSLKESADNINELEEDNILNQENITEIIDLLPKVSNEGESITLENTARAKFTKFRIEGNSKQETRSGKNLINSFYNYSAGYTRTNKGVTFTLLEDGKIRVNGTATGGRAVFTFAIPETTIKVGNYVLSQGSEKAQIETKIGDTYYTVAGSSSNISIVEEQKENTNNIEDEVEEEETVAQKEI